jgi:hypothetical protein
MNKIGRERSRDEFPNQHGMIETVKAPGDRISEGLQKLMPLD